MFCQTLYWCVYLKCLYGCKIYCCVLNGVQLVLSSVTKQSLSATPGQPTIIFTLTRQQMQRLSTAPSLSIQSVRQAREVEPTCYRTAKVASTIHVFFLSRHLLDFFSLLQWGWHVVRGRWIGCRVGNELTGTPLFSSQTHTWLKRDV